MFSVSCILASLQRFLGHNGYEKESCLLYKYHPRLVLFRMPSLIVKLYKAIEFLYNFRYRKGKT